MELVRVQRSATPTTLNEKERTVDVLVSTDDVDSHDSRVIQNLDLSRYRQNPTVLWSHDTGSPVGRLEPSMNLETLKRLLAYILGTGAYAAEGGQIPPCVGLPNARRASRLGRL